MAIRCFHHDINAELKTIEFYLLGLAIKSELQQKPQLIWVKPTVLEDPISFTGMELGSSTVPLHMWREK